MPPVTDRDKPGLCSTSYVIMFDQNWHHLYSSSAGGKDLSSDTQIRVIGSMEPEICTKMLRNLSEKLRAKFPATTDGYPKQKA